MIATLDRLLKSAPLLKDASASGNMTVLKSLLGPAWRGIIQQRARSAQSTTMPLDYGLFLETSYRLHPTVCAFISEAFYDGKLEPDESTKGQDLATSNGSGGVGLPS